MSCPILETCSQRTEEGYIACCFGNWNGWECEQDCQVEEECELHAIAGDAVVIEEEK